MRFSPEPEPLTVAVISDPSVESENEGSGRGYRERGWGLWYAIDELTMVAELYEPQGLRRLTNAYDSWTPKAMFVSRKF